MAALSLPELFGANAYQDSDFLVINKGDFFQLTASATNTAESLFVAILLNAHHKFEGNIEDENNKVVTDELNRGITFSHLNLYELLDVFYWKRQFLEGEIVDTFVVEHNEIS